MIDLHNKFVRYLTSTLVVLFGISCLVGFSWLVNNENFGMELLALIVVILLIALVVFIIMFVNACIEEYIERK